MIEWRNAITQIGELQRQIVSLDEAAAKDASELAGLAVDEGLLSEGAAIDALRERLGAVRKAADDLPRRRQARDVAMASLNDAARKLALSSYTEVLSKLPNEMALASLIWSEARRKLASERRETVSRCAELSGD